MRFAGVKITSQNNAGLFEAGCMSQVDCWFWKQRKNDGSCVNGDLVLIHRTHEQRELSP